MLVNEAYYNNVKSNKTNDVVWKEDMLELTFSGGMRVLAKAIICLLPYFHIKIFAWIKQKISYMHSSWTIHLGEYLIHAWVGFVTNLQKYTSFPNSWSNSKEYKNLDAVVHDQLLAANANTIAFRWKNIILVWLWFCIVWTVFNTTIAWHFHHYIYGLRKITR